MSLPIITPLQVMYFDTDAGGVVHNIAYLRFIEIARTLLITQMGMSFENILQTNIHPVVVRTEIDYLKPARLGDCIEVHARLEKFTGVRFWCKLEILRPRDGAKLVQCQQTLALVKMPEGQLLRLPKDFSTSFSFPAGNYSKTPLK